MTKKITPAHLYQLAVLLMVVLHFTFRGTLIAPSPLNLLGVPLLVGGSIFAIVAERLFKRHNNPMMPWMGEPALLLTTGPFSYSRNPMYLGVSTALIGIAIILGTTSALAVSILYVLLMQFHYIPVEERLLRQYFGKSYEEYVHRVRRWI